MATIKKKIERFREWKQKHKNFGMTSFLAVAIVGYALFFTSTIWFPNYGKLVTETPYYEKVVYGEYSFYLTQFVYCEAEEAVQVIIEKENSDVKDQSFQYTAVERKKGNLDVSVVQEESSYVILRISNVTGWREISLRIQARGNENQAKFYANADNIKRVKSLPERSESGYRIERLEAQILQDDMQIKDKEEQIQSLQKENEDILNRIQELESDVYPTEDEAKSAKEIVAKAKNRKQANETTIQDREEEIRKLQERTDNIRKQIEEIKEGQEK